MEGEIISKEFIKPSSPTPPHKKTYKLSLFDQIAPPIFVPVILYFPNTTMHNTTPSLKHSLSTTLSHFYPLAGRINDPLSIDCNDQGLLFVVAKFSYRLSDFLQNPDANATCTHIPTLLTWAEPGPGDQVAMVQLSHFDCGGVAISALILHKVADGASIATFMKSWAAAARGCAAETVLPEYTPGCLFPQNASMQRESHIFSAIRRYFGYGKTVMRRYVFDAASISKLRAACLSEPERLEQRRPTRVGTVSAFLWKCFMEASATARSDRSMSLVTHGVNMRRKSEQQLPEQSFGNYVWLTPASSSNGEADRNLKVLFEKVRGAIGRIDVEFVKRMEEDVGFEGYCTNLEESLKGFVENADYLAMSSWCNFGFYDVDFWWGKPAWISKCDCGSDVECPFLNIVLLIDTRERDGIEAFVTLGERFFAELDKIKELRDLALIDPSPLEIAGIKQPSDLSDGTITS